MGFHKATLNYLVLNSRKAFRRKELARVIGTSRKYMTNILRRLEHQGFIEHKQPYWIMKKGVHSGRLLSWIKGLYSINRKWEGTRWSFKWKN